MNPENITAGENGRMEIVFPIENPHGQPIVLELKRLSFWQHLLPFTAGGEGVDRYCHVDHVTSKSTPTQLVFSIDLKRCLPPLKDPLDLADMSLSRKYSIGGVKQIPRTYSLPQEYDTGFYERFKMLFAGGKKLLLPSFEVVDVSEFIKLIENHSKKLNSLRKIIFKNVFFVNYYHWKNYLIVQKENEYNLEFINLINGILYNK